MSKVAQGKIVYLLSLLVMIFIVLSALSVQQLNQAEEMRRTEDMIETIHRVSLDLFRADVDFYRHDIINPEFFASGTSEHIKHHQATVAQAYQFINEASNMNPVLEPGQFSSIRRKLVVYDSSFNVLAGRIREKGFKNFGLEGKLRNYAHELEDKNLIPTGELLMLRRHEKDYLLRHEQEYIEKFDALSATLRNKYQRNTEAASLLGNYLSAFHELISASEAIGMETQNGLKGLANQQTADLVDALNEMSESVEASLQSTHQKSLNFFIITVLVGSAVSIMLIIRVAKKI